MGLHCSLRMYHIIIYNLGKDEEFGDLDTLGTVPYGKRNRHRGYYVAQFVRVTIRVHIHRGTYVIIPRLETAGDHHECIHFLFFFFFLFLFLFLTP